MIGTNKPKSNSLGFISFDPELKDEQGNLHPEPIGFAMVQVAGNRHEFIQVVELFLLPLDRPRLINGILAIAEKWPLPEIYVDQIPTMETYTWLNGDRMYTNTVTRRRELSTAIYPRLNAYALRHKNAQARQRDQLAHRISVKDGQEYPDLIFNELIELEAMSILQHIGQNAALDALAGAVEIAAKLQHRLRRQLDPKQLDTAPTIVAFT